MRSIDARTPVLIGGGQGTWRPPDLGPEPLDMWEHVARAAARDTGAPTDRVLAAIDSVQVVYCQSWQYDDPPARLAERLGLGDGERYYSGIGGSTPQELANRAARRILAGELDAALIVGAEALDTKRRLKKQDQRPDWSHRATEKRPFPFPYEIPKPEIDHGIFQAYLTFALFDSARRGARGTDLQAYRERLGRLLEPMTRIAADNPYSWFPVERDADEIITPTDDNRMVASPYTKFMISVMDVDMAGAFLLVSEATADELGVPRERRVYLRGFAYAQDPWAVGARGDMARSVAMEQASRQALQVAGVGVDDLAHLDLYSCFTSSVLFARDALGIADDDDRPVTVTGGLPYFGGLGSGYMLMSIAEMASVLRDDAGSFGLTSGVGMHLSKHVFGVWSTGPGALEPGDPTALQAAVDDGSDARDVVGSYTGTAQVVACSVLHGRDGTATNGAVVLELPDGTRAYANVEEPELLAAMERDEWVGRDVEVVSKDDRNLVIG